MRSYFVGAAGVFFGSVLWEMEALLRGDIGPRTMIQGAFAAAVLVVGYIAQRTQRHEHSS